MPSTNLSEQAEKNITTGPSVSPLVSASNTSFTDRLFLPNLNIKHQVWLLIGGLFLMIFIWDVLTRLHVSSVAYPSKQEQFNIASAQHSLLDKQTQHAINELYANFDAPEPEVSSDVVNKPKLGMSLEEQQAQNGKLDTLFIDDNQYLLSGVFWDKQYFAVLLKIDVNTSTPEEIKVAQGQVFSGYTIERIAKQHITFVNGARTITLSMFK